MIVYLIIVFLVIVAIQDYLFRSISAVLIPVGTILFGIHSYTTNGFNNFKDYYLLNLIFICIQLSVLLLFFLIKNRRFTNIINSHLGSGDIYFLLVISFFFSPFNFILFLTISLILIMIINVLDRLTNSLDAKSIPLAGHLAIFILILILINVSNKSICFYDDQLIFNKVSNIMMSKF
jgi:hypothetical protein